MSRFLLKIRHHIKNQENLKLKEKRYTIDSNAKMTEMLEIPDKDFKAAIINVFNKQHKHGWNKWKIEIFIKKKKSHERNRRYKEELNGNFIIEKQITEI